MVSQKSLRSMHKVVVVWVTPNLQVLYKGGLRVPNPVVLGLQGQKPCGIRALGLGDV